MAKLFRYGKNDATTEGSLTDCTVQTHPVYKVQPPINNHVRDVKEAKASTEDLQSEVG